MYIHIWVFKSIDLYGHSLKIANVDDRKVGVLAHFQLGSDNSMVSQVVDLLNCITYHWFLTAYILIPFDEPLCTKHEWHDLAAEAAETSYADAMLANAYCWDITQIMMYTTHIMFT